MSVARAESCTDVAGLVPEFLKYRLKIVIPSPLLSSSMYAVTIGRFDPCQFLRATQTDSKATNALNAETPAAKDETSALNSALVAGMCFCLCGLMKMSPTASAGGGVTYVGVHLAIVAGNPL